MSSSNNTSGSGENTVSLMSGPAGSRGMTCSSASQPKKFLRVRARDAAALAQVFEEVEEILGRDSGERGGPAEEPAQQPQIAAEGADGILAEPFAYHVIGVGADRAG